MSKTFSWLLFSIIIVALLSAGMYWYTSNPSQQNQQSTTQLTPDLSPQVTHATQPTITQTNIEQRLLQLYKDYEQSQPNGVDSLYQKGYLTQESYTTLKKPYAYDPVLCTQGGSQAPIEVDSITISEPTATAIVKQYYAASKTYNYIKIAVQLEDQKVTSITCNYTK